MSVFPINWQDKVNSPALLAYLQQFGPQGYLSAEEINKVRDALNELEEFKAPLVGGLIPQQYLPSYVDDVLEFNNVAAFPSPGESGKIYVAKDTNYQYRWSGSNYIIFSTTPALPGNDNKIYGIKNGAWNEIQASSYKGSWNASTNSPTLVNGTGTLGDEYKVSTSGYSLSKIWIKGDIIFYDGANWIRKCGGINPLIDFPKYREITIGPLGMSNFGLYAAETGTIANYVLTNTVSGFSENIDNFRELKTAATSGSVAKLTDPASGYIPHTANYDMGFYYSFRFHEKTPNVDGRFFMGLTYVNASGSMGNTNPSSYIYGALGVGLDSGDTNYQLFTRESTASSVVKYNTGFAKGSNDIFEATFIRFKGSSNVIFILKNQRTGAAFVKEFAYTDGVARKTIDFNLNNSTSSSAFGIGYSFIKMLTT